MYHVSGIPEIGLTSSKFKVQCSTSPPHLETLNLETLNHTLFGKPKAMPEITAILAGSLDDPSWFRLAMDI